MKRSLTLCDNISYLYGCWLHEISIFSRQPFNGLIIKREFDKLMKLYIKKKINSTTKTINFSLSLNLLIFCLNFTLCLCILCCFFYLFQMSEIRSGTNFFLFIFSSFNSTFLLALHRSNLKISLTIEFD